MSYRIRYPGGPEESAASPKIRWKAAITIGVLLFVSVLTFPGIRTYAEIAVCRKPSKRSCHCHEGACRGMVFGR